MDAARAGGNMLAIRSNYKPMVELYERLDHHDKQKARIILTHVVTEVVAIVFLIVARGCRMTNTGSSSSLLLLGVLFLVGGLILTNECIVNPIRECKLPEVFGHMVAIILGLVIIAFTYTSLCIFKFNR